ncbi:MAG: 4'-phosphopantetheinyl transferase superfamily protein [Myxococcales bacterium]|nr:4'-phosphopantetheinyl transferase superfamily protein [Myxococcales bacterium]
MSDPPIPLKPVLAQLTSGTTYLLGSSQFHVGARKITSEVPSLGPQEQKTLGHAAPKRYREFATARSLARQLLSEIGQPCTDLPRHTDGYPSWPVGTWGSISHSHQVAIAAVRYGDRGFGIDIEGSRPIERTLHPHILRPNELNFCAESRRNALAKIVFSAKEAFYKAQYPLTNVFLNFHDVEIHLHEQTQRYSVKVYHPVVNKLPMNHFRGGWIIVEPYVLTTAYFVDK